MAEDRFLQDLIDAEYKAEDDLDVDIDSEDEAGQRMAEDRKAQAGRRAMAKSREMSDHVMKEGPREKDGKSCISSW